MKKRKKPSLARIAAHKLLVAGHAAKLRLNGGKVHTPTGRLIHVDPTDPRAHVLSRKGGAVDTNAVRAWRKIIDEVQPNVVVDVGANYGEVTFSTFYPRGTEVHLIEANPRLLPYLRRTAVPWDAMVHEGAASDAPGRVALSISRRSSGLSSLEKRSGSDVAIEVESFRLDDLLPQISGRAAIKIDVEGHEAAVLRGMTEMLDRLEDVLLLVEVNNNCIDYLIENFHIQMFEPSSSELKPLQDPGEIYGHQGRYTKDAILRPK